MKHPSNHHDESSEENKRKREDYKKVWYQNTRDGENLIGNSGSGKSLNLSSHMQFLLCTHCGTEQSDITKQLKSTTIQN